MKELELMSDEEKEILEILKEVYDPELGINVVDLGLIYEIFYSAEEGIHIEMTLTTPNCPMAEAVEEDVKKKVENRFPDQHILVIIVWVPAWNPDRISPEGLRKLHS